MTTREKVISIAAVLVLLIAAFIGYELVQEHDARIKAESVESAQKQIIDTNAKSIQAAKQDQEKTASDLKAQLAAIGAQRTIIVTPQQAAQALPTIVPNLPQPVQLQTVPATPTAPATQNLIIPQADIPAFQAYKLNYDESNARLLACTNDKDDLQTQLTATAAQFHAEELSAASWEATAKGGTFWHRVKHDAMVIGITAGTAYLAGRYGK